MNYAPKTYALAFCEAIEAAKNSAEKDKRLKNLLAIVKSNRDQKKLKDVLFFVKKIMVKKNNGRLMLIESARSQSAASEKIIKSLIKSADIVENKINKSLIAGIKININDELLLDGSFSTKIKKILNLQL